MQASAIIEAAALGNLLRHVYETGVPEVYEAYSEYGQSLKRFETAAELDAHIRRSIDAGESFSQYAVYYPDTRGAIQQRRIALDPKRCGGHNFRYSLDGWGVIQLHYDFRTRPDIECRIAVNTQKRANTWSATYPDMGPPAAWNWKLIERHAGQLIRQLKKLARPVNTANGLANRLER